MSECKCEHNDHSHFLIYFFIWCSMFFPSCVDCMGEKRQVKDDISHIDSRVSGLETDVTNLRIKVNRQARDISNLEDEVVSLRNKNFYQDQDFEVLKKECKKNFPAAMPKQTR